MWGDWDEAGGSSRCGEVQVHSLFWHDDLFWPGLQLIIDT